MITYKCKECGGQLELGGTSGFVCPYCGSKSFMSDADFKGNEEFRKKLLQIYTTEAKNKDYDYSSDTIWVGAGMDCFSMQSGQSLQIVYMKKYEYNGFTCYLAKESVVYIFDNEKESMAFMSGVNRMVFPPADTRLHRSFPELKMQIELEAGKIALVFRRRPNLYPAELFSPWESKHLAWVISRMENICCALNYAGIEHGDITPISVWINPTNHEGALFGDWRRIHPLQDTKDLADLRRTAIRLAKNTREPKEMYTFLNSKPQADAFTDFEKWDQVITNGFGGHNFIKM